ncbi:hypothetical protein ACJZ2D_011145 [Fusarium nematophilum]
MVSSNQYAFPLEPGAYAPAPVASLQEWQQLWKVWDLVTIKMIPADALMEQPIPLRNPLLFYLGHIPTFEDIHLTRATRGNPTDPAQYHAIFERGIVPDVDDPSTCHSHSELPEVFPPWEEILVYRERVNDGSNGFTRRAWRTLIVVLDVPFGLASSMRTFLFMTIQSSSILPPPGLPKPDFARLAKEAESHRLENRWLRIPCQTFTIGFHDPEKDDGPNRFFAWDNEREPYDVHVHEFEAQGRPVSNGDYASYLFDVNYPDIPATWSKSRPIADSDETLNNFISHHSVKTVWGPVPLIQALDWPVMASFDEVERYADWAGARIPTLHELRSIHEHAGRHRTAVDSKINKTCHINPEAIFVDLTGTNSGFNNFHPVSVKGKSQLCGLEDTGGVAEWTSDLFAPQPGFKPMDIYPGYSADFMDGKHISVVGGSWALHPRITGRKSFLNWWKKKYLWPWVTFRLVRDT